MTVTVPKWLLVATAVVLVAIAAFVLGRSVNNGQGLNLAGESEQTVECDKKSGLKGVQRYIQKKGEDGPPLLEQYSEELVDSIYAEVVACSDLTGDGSEEMVLIVDGVNAGGAHLVSWYILEQGNGSWKGLFRRTVPTPQLDVEDGFVRESTPGYLEDAPMGAPSYRRVGRIVFRNDSFRYLSSGPDVYDRAITVSPETGRVDGIGPLDAFTTGRQEAISALGRSSAFFETSAESCSVTWSDLGLEIRLANLGGLDPCRDGFLVAATLQGSAAETAGWTGPRGARIGMTFNSIVERFPSTSRDEYGIEPSGVEPDWEAWVLLEAPSPFAEGVMVPSIVGYFDRKSLRRLDFYTAVID